MNRTEKETFVSSLRSALEGAEIVIVTKQSGLTVSESSALRAKMRETGASFKISKNTLAKLAVQGLACEVVSDLLNGPTGISYGNDPVATAKTIADFMKKNEKMEILGASFGGKFLNSSAVNQLAQLPSRDELRSKLIALLQAPATQIARITREPAALVARVCSAYGRK